MFLGAPVQESGVCLGPGVCKNNVPPTRRRGLVKRAGGVRRTNTYLRAQFNVVSVERVGGVPPNRKERLFCKTGNPPSTHVAFDNIETRGAHIGRVCISAAGGRRCLRRRRNVIFANTGLWFYIRSRVSPRTVCSSSLTNHSRHRQRSSPGSQFGWSHELAFFSGMVAHGVSLPADCGTSIASSSATFLYRGFRNAASNHR